MYIYYITGHSDLLTASHTVPESHPPIHQVIVETSKHVLFTLHCTVVLYVEMFLLTPLGDGIAHFRMVKYYFLAVYTYLKNLYDHLFSDVGKTKNTFWIHFVFTVKLNK